MISKCPECGKTFDVLWPNLWRYKRGVQYICSWSCLRKFDGKEAEQLTMRTKKDGTPAMKPGPKKRIEMPEKILANPIADAVCIETPEKPKKTIEYKITGICTAVGQFQYFKHNKVLEWTDLNDMTVSMSLEEWREFMKIFPEALKVLGVNL